MSWWPPYAWFTYTRSQLNTIVANQAIIIANQAKEATAMSKVTDLLTQVQTDLAKTQSDAQAIIAILSQPSPDVQAAIDGLTTIDSGLQSINQSLEAATGTPAPTTTQPPSP